VECCAKREREGAEVITMGSGRLLTQDGKELKLIPTLLLLVADSEPLSGICQGISRTICSGKSGR
jgi:hypothetical protein